MLCPASLLRVKSSGSLIGGQVAMLHVTLQGGPAMTQSEQPKSSRERVRRYRERLRKQGLRPIQIWVPDVRAAGFRAEARRQSLAVAESAHAEEDQAFIDAVSELDDT